MAEGFLTHFDRFGFFEAVQLLERMHPEKAKLGEALRPGEEAIRFNVKPGIAFPPSDLSDVREAEQGDFAVIESSVMGLIGPSGVLPNWYNELAQERKEGKDAGMTEFYDLFHHRLLSFFYLAWKRNRVVAAKEPDDVDPFSRCLLSLVGLGTDELAARLGPLQSTLMFWSGQLGRQVRSAATIASVLQDHFDVPVEIEQFVPRLIVLDRENRTLLGEANSELGINASCGDSAWERQSKFRLLLGPLHYETFSKLLPTGDLLRPLVALVRYMAGVEYEFEVRLLLRKEEVPTCRLGGLEFPAPALGWSTWIRSSGTSIETDGAVTIDETEIARI